MDIQEIIGGVFIFIVGIWLIRELTNALSIPFGSLFIGLFIAIGIAWFIKEVLGR